MEEKRYLKLKDKLFYGMGDFASNIFSVTVGSFVLVFLTNAVGLNPVIIGTLMGISKLLGGSDLIITGMQAVGASGAVAPIMLNTEYEDYVSDMRRIVDAVHANGSKLIVQLQHCGSKTWPAEGFDHFAVCETKVSGEMTYHEATKKELQKVAADFGRSARLCKEAGADGRYTVHTDILSILFCRHLQTTGQMSMVEQPKTGHVFSLRFIMQSGKKPDRILLSG